MTAGRLLATGAIAISALLSGCGADDDEPQAASVTSSATPVDPSFAQLCGVLDLAIDGDIEEARAAFDHGPLHTLADAATEVDRTVASRLLQAKEGVEADLAGSNTSPSLIVDNLRTLIEVTADALVATGAAASPPRCEGL